MKIIKNAMLLEHQKPTNVVFNENEIIAIADDISEYESKADEIVDAKACHLLPGLVDVHVHLREPGFENKETIQSGTKAAARGGFTTICPMPNVIPYPDSMESVKKYLALIEKNALVHVKPYACISRGQDGKELVDIKGIKELGVRFFSDDGLGVESENIMEEAMKKAKQEDVFIVAHTEDMSYRKKDSSVHESEINRKRGYVGIPSECESEQLKRDILLAEKTKCAYHACHISAKQSVDALKEAKKKGLNITAEVTAHHLLLEDKDVKGPNWKMNPPLRSKKDRQALIEGLENGSLDFIANDHAPHTEEEKQRDMVKAPFGVVALETSFALLYTEFVKKQKRWTLKMLVDWMSKKPAQRFGFDRCGEIKKGFSSDFFIVDLEKSYIIDPNDFISKGKNTPFSGYEVNGKVLQCFVNGKCVFKEA